MKNQQSIHPLISIGIPLYNGEETISATLDSILKQNLKNIEIVLCDDSSSDRTFEIASKFSNKYQFIKSYKNDSNIGMDRNFLKTAKLCSGRYVWFFGQDDYLRSGAINKVKDALKYNDIGIVYINYRYFDKNQKRLLVSNYLETIIKNEHSILKDKSEIFYEDSNLFFKDFLDLPNFLPATVMKRRFWNDIDFSDFIGTAYVQVAAQYLNIDKCKIVVITKPYVNGTIPDDNWQVNGRSLFMIMAGYLKMQKLVNKKNPGSIPKFTFLHTRNKFLLNYIFHIYLCRTLNLKVERHHIDLLKEIFGNRILFKLYLRPILLVPYGLLKVLYYLLLPLKKISKFLISNLIKGNFFFSRMK